MRICVLTAGKGAVSFYRIKQPLIDLIEQGHEIFIFNPDIHDGARLNKEQEHADIIVFQLPWDKQVYQSALLIKLGKAFKKKKKIIIELDDNLFNVDPFNEKYNNFGIEEKQITIKQTDIKTIDIYRKNLGDWVRERKNRDGTVSFDMWRDGYCDFNISKNLENKIATEKLLNIADLITVTTKELGKQIRKIAPKTKIAILPNYIDFKRWLPMEKNNTKEIRIGWQGGSAHFDDMRLIINDLLKIDKKYNSGKTKKVTFCFMGIAYESLLKDFKGKIEYYPWHKNIYTYPLIVRQMKLDIGLAPLKDTTFNRGKSPLKWLEYSALNIPTIASDIVYGDYIKHQKTGIIAKENEWFKYIDELIQDKEKRINIAKKANSRVKSIYNEKNSSLWLSAYKDIL